MDWVPLIGLALAAYLLGSIPPAYLLVRLVKGVDIRQVGSRNAGATNTYHQVGLWAGALVLLADAAKGAVAAMLPGWVGAPDWVVFLTGALVVAGHNWPVFLGFRGGKGAATILGVSLALAPVLTLITLAPTALLVLLSRNIIIGAGVGFILLNTLVAVTGQGAEMVALCLFLTVLVTVTYIVGIRRQITTAIRTRRWRELFYAPGPRPEDQRRIGGPV